jgi:hypothetical protein
MRASGELYILANLRLFFELGLYTQI